MCWRGHGPEHIRIYRRKGDFVENFCRRCHLLRIRNYRHPDYSVKRRPLFALNASEYKRLKRRYGWTDLTVAVMTGMSRAGISDYLRGGRGGKRQAVRASRERAARISQAMRCDFSQLWSEA
jgi:hypothetical protein